MKKQIKEDLYNQIWASLPEDLMPTINDIEGLGGILILDPTSVFHGIHKANIPLRDQVESQLRQQIPLSIWND